MMIINYIKKYFKLLFLMIPYFWYLDADWDWSYEMDYMRRPRQFWKNRLFNDYMINSIYWYVPYNKREVIKIFVSDYINHKLIDDTLCLIHNEDKRRIIDNNKNK